MSDPSLADFKKMCQCIEDGECMNPVVAIYPCEIETPDGEITNQHIRVCAWHRTLFEQQKKLQKNGY